MFPGGVMRGKGVMQAVVRFVRDGGGASRQVQSE